MYERFTDMALKVMSIANDQAIAEKLEYIRTEHILLALITQENCIAVLVLKNLGLDISKIKVEVGYRIQHTCPYPQAVKKVIQYAQEESKAQGNYHVGTEHILIGLIRESEGAAAKVLARLGLTLEDVRNEARNLLNKTENQPKLEQPARDSRKYLGVENEGLSSFANELNVAYQNGWTEIVEIKIELGHFIALVKQPD